jgi:hypothetical protein
MKTIPGALGESPMFQRSYAQLWGMENAVRCERHLKALTCGFDDPVQRAATLPTAPRL